MQSAPSVSYPVGRSRLVWRLHLGIWLVGVLSLALCGLQMPDAPTRSAGVALALLAAALGVWHASRSSEHASLHWDGRQWHLERRSGIRLPIGAISAPLDLQSILLLRLTPVDGATCWVWAERATHPARWLPLRRAIYARAAVVPPNDAASAPAS
jgi:toxin CptA